MIADLKPYPDYRESGLPWLGQVPRHWAAGPGFAVFREKQTKNRGMKEKTVLSLSYGRIVVKPAEKLHGLVPESFETYQIVEPGDIIIRSTDLQNDWNSKRVGLVRDRGIITSAYLCFLTTGGMSPEYGYLMLHAFDLMKVFYGLGSGLRQNLDFGDFKRMLIFMPPPAEQLAIVKFLDWAHGRLERAMRAKRKVIALLREQKQAIIHRAVTRGLDPFVPVKPSGVSWLGDIPQHWGVRPLKQLLSRMDYGTSESARGEGPIRVLTMGHIRDGRVLVPERGGLDAIPPGLLVEANDLLFNRTNSPELVGKVGCFSGVAEDQVTFASYLVRLRVRSDHSPVWLNYVLNSALFWAYARSQALVSLHQANLNPKRYGQMFVPVPPEREQQRIVARLLDEVKAIESTSSRLEREIELLHEYRTRLVADAVTGKLDLRQAASRLPDEAPLDAVDDDGEMDTDLDAIDEGATA